MLIRIIKLRLFIIFYFCLSTSMAQQWCGYTVSAAEKENYRNNLYQTQRQARKGVTYKINIRPKIIHSSDKVIRFTDSQVIDLINSANLIFKNINIQFVIFDNKIEHIYDDNYFDFKLKNEATLRKNHDSNDGINMYFTKSITTENLNILNGYATLPNLSNSSNVVILSYLDNSAQQFLALKNKIIPHELGHYFGLLHTYHDSNNDDINERELVTRGVGSNCILKGDQICDTPADPFERFPSLSSLQCNEPIPSSLFDINGDYYYPYVDNIMSYQTKCGNEFTEGQLLRIENSLNIRLSPKAEYRLSGNLENFIRLKSLPERIICQNTNLTIDYEINGEYDLKNDLKIEISDKNGKNFSPFIGTISNENNQIKIFISSLYEPGENYRVIIKSTQPETESPISESFAIMSLPTASISVESSEINQGSSTSIIIKFGGSGPWGFTDWDGQVYEKVIYETVYLNIAPRESKVYDISRISNSCGITGQPLKVLVNVIKPNLTILGDDRKNFCEFSKVTLELNSKNGSVLNENHLVILSFGSLIYKIVPQINSNQISFFFPSNIIKELVYNLQVLGMGMGDFSQIIKIKIHAKPHQPSIISPVKVCYGTSSPILFSKGENLKWYLKENDLYSIDKVSINTKTPGIFYFFVSQSDSIGCESLKSKIEVEVDEPVSATISGKFITPLGSSSSLIVKFTGSSPWEVKISDFNPITVFESTYTMLVSPSKSTDYIVESVSNRCGPGSSAGLATVEVILTLANESDLDIINVFPNPNSGSVININSKFNITKVKLLNLLGQEFYSSNYSSKIISLPIHVNISSGNYLLFIETDNGVFSRFIYLIQ